MQTRVRNLKIMVSKRKELISNNSLDPLELRNVVWLGVSEKLAGEKTLHLIVTGVKYPNVSFYVGSKIELNWDPYHKPKWINSTDNFSTLVFSMDFDLPLDTQNTGLSKNVTCS